MLLLKQHHAADARHPTVQQPLRAPQSVSVLVSVLPPTCCVPLPSLGCSYWPNNYTADSQHPVWQLEGHVGKLGDFPCYNPDKVHSEGWLSCSKLLAAAAAAASSSVKHMAVV